MHSQPRYFVISAPRFDATTPLDPVALLPKGVNPGGNSFPIPSQNQPRLSATLTAPVGRFSIRSLLRPGNLGALVRVRCITPAPQSVLHAHAVHAVHVDVSSGMSPHTKRE